MHIKIRDKDNILIFDIEGSIEVDDVSEFCNLLKGYIESNHYNVLYNLEKVTYISTLGLGFLVASYKKISNHNGHFAIFGMNDNIKDIFNISKLVSVIKVYPTEAAAIADLFKEGKVNQITKPQERRYERIPYITEVVFYRSLWKNIMSHFGHTKDISRGGLYIKTTSTFEKGTLLKVEFPLKIPNKKEEKIRAIMKVAWVADKKSHPEHFPGMGLDIVSINEDDMKKVNEFFKKKI